MTISQARVEGIIENTTVAFETDRPQFLGTLSDRSDLINAISETTSRLSKFTEKNERPSSLQWLIRSIFKSSSDPITSVQCTPIGIACMPTITTARKQRDITGFLEYDILRSVSPPLEEEVVPFIIEQIEECPSIRKE